MTKTPRTCNASGKMSASWEMYGERITCPECDKRIKVRKDGRYADHTEAAWVAKAREREMVGGGAR